MQTLILPGFGASNKEWVDEVTNNLDIEGIIRPFYWMHWTDKDQKFGVQEKADLIVKHVRKDKVNIVAKSIGTLVASLVYKMIPDQIEKLVLNGIPVHDITSEELETIKSSISSGGNKIIVFQNVDDPHGSFDEVKDFGNVIKTDRNDHNYPFYDQFQDFLK